MGGAIPQAGGCWGSGLANRRPIRRWGIAGKWIGKPPAYPQAGDCREVCWQTAGQSIPLILNLLKDERNGLTAAKNLEAL